MDDITFDDLMRALYETTGSRELSPDEWAPILISLGKLVMRVNGLTYLRPPTQSVPLLVKEENRRLIFEPDDTWTERPGLYFRDDGRHSYPHRLIGVLCDVSRLDWVSGCIEPTCGQIPCLMIRMERFDYRDVTSFLASTTFEPRDIVQRLCDLVFEWHNETEKHFKRAETIVAELRAFRHTARGAGIV